jgi:hypothetical protein
MILIDAVNASIAPNEANASGADRGERNHIAR